MKGQVYKQHTDTFVVKSSNGLEKVGVKGVMRRAELKPVVGDFVEYVNGVVSKVLPRKNYFPRPNVANIDTVVIVVSPEPKPDFILIDKLVVNALSRDLEIIFAINKADIEDGLFELVKKEYKDVPAKFYKVSASANIGLKEFSDEISGKLVLFAGQSAVGKTSLVNGLFGLDLKTGDISEKIGRGKHTTTSSSIYELFDTRIIDTPGFAVIDADIKSDELADCYPEYFALSSNCKYRGCRHISEPQCAVKTAVENEELSSSRYERYIQIYNELVEKEKYDENY